MSEDIVTVALCLASAAVVIAAVVGQFRKAKKDGPRPTGPPPYRGRLNDCGAHPIVRDKERT